MISSAKNIETRSLMASRVTGLPCRTCPVRGNAACSVLTEEERDAIARAGRMRRLRRGELLFAAGDEDASCATLVTGALKVSAIGEEGTERILALIHAGGFIGELFAPIANHDVVALTDSELCVFPKSAMRGAVELHPKLAHDLLRRSENDLHRSRKLLALSGRRSAADKVGALLLGLAKGLNDSPCNPAREFELPLTRGEIAGILGLTIETVSRSLTRFERGGVIRRKGARRIELVDPPRLGYAAEGAAG